MTITVSKKATAKIIGFEVGSRLEYNKFYSIPTWPTGQSGVTIGIGYDLGYNLREQIAEDWGGVVNGNGLSYFLLCSGRKGLDAKKMINEISKTFVIGWDAAVRVFEEKTLPRFVKSMARAYPGIEELNADTTGAVLSLVFNRGTSFGTPDSKSWNQRAEMRGLAHLIQQKDYEGIASAIRSMKRLWDGKDDNGNKSETELRLEGLITRREDEAQLVEFSQHEYTPEQVLTYQI